MGKGFMTTILSEDIIMANMNVECIQNLKYSLYINATSKIKTAVLSEKPLEYNRLRNYYPKCRKNCYKGIRRCPVPSSSPTPQYGNTHKQDILKRRDKRLINMKKLQHPM
jgi:hypothetical protein